MPAPQAPSNPPTPVPPPHPSLVGWAEANPTLAAAFIALTGVLLGGFLVAVIWPILKGGLERLWDRLISRVTGKAFENRYLDWVIGKHRYLPILPTTLVPATAEGHRQELDALYVSLAIGSDADRDVPVNLGSALKTYKRLIVVGDPGSGKTTMLRFLALTSLGRAENTRQPTSKLSGVSQNKKY